MLADAFDIEDVKIVGRKRAGCCMQFKQICKRNTTSIKRNPMVFKARVGQNVFLGLIAGAVFWKASDGSTITDLQNLTGAMFFCSIITFMAPFMMTTTTFQGERPVFLREQANKMYNVLPYYVAKMLAELPVFVAVPLIFNAVTYFMIGFNKITE